MSRLAGGVFFAEDLLRLGVWGAGPTPKAALDEMHFVRREWEFIRETCPEDFL